jgi:glucose 1-dehydrogenase
MYKENLKGQTSIITGSSSGIGQAVAECLAAAGSNVVINYSSSKVKADEVAAAINAKNYYGKAIVIQADVSIESDVLAMFKETIETFGTVDICVANSGIQIDHKLHEMPLDAWKKVIDINLTGQFLCAREALKEFLRRGMRTDVSNSLGKIIHMSSVHEIIPWAGHANYAASKGGLQMLMKSICQGYASSKVRCNSIAPGAIRTDINKYQMDTEDKEDKIKLLIPYNQIGKPEDIGRVAAWLASDDSEYVNGETLFVDGGMSCYPGFNGNG